VSEMLDNIPGLDDESDAQEAEDAAAAFEADPAPEPPSQ
jgi:hypothetical protein